MEYVSHVLPTLGEDSVDQRAVAELVPGVELTRVDPPDVQRLKADTRLGEVVRRAANAASEGEPQELVVRLEGRFVGVEADEVAELLDEARTELGLTAAARERFRMNVLRRFYEDYGVRLGGQAFRNFEEVERALRQDGRLTKFLDASWPAPKPEQVVRRLLASPPAPPACSTRTSGGSCGVRGAAGARPTSRCWTRLARSWSRRRPATGT